jgi:phosphatidylserine/phosphatidylglycerophosphate/cardiolipin synthase-like enzyme
VWTSIGSINIDNRSFALNHELNLRLSQEIAPQTWKRGAVGHVLELFVLPFRNLL